MTHPQAWMVLALSLAAAPILAADKPGPLAGPDKKLDYLLETWKGRTLDELRSVWGEENSVRPIGAGATYVYEKTSRVRTGASIFTGQVKVETGSITCVAFFEVSDADVIVGVRRSGGGKPCWKAFKGNRPPK